jgi:hypothetical protein
VVVAAGFLMSFGCALRSGLEFNDFLPGGGCAQVESSWTHTLKAAGFNP